MPFFFPKQLLMINGMGFVSVFEPESVVRDTLKDLVSLHFSVCFPAGNPTRVLNPDTPSNSYSQKEP